MAKIIVTSENFCFGSTGMLISLLSLFKHKHEILFIGTGTALELAKKEGYQSYIDIETSSKKFRKILNKKSSDYDLLISSMDIDSAVFAKKIGMKVVWLDNIFWYRDSIPPELASVDYFFCQKGISGDYVSKAKKFRISNFYLVGPLIPKFRPQKRENKLIVSFGGAEASGFYKFGQETNYPFMMAELIVNYVDLDRFEEVFFVSNEAVILELSKKFSHLDLSKYRFVSLDHDNFINLISSSSLLLTSPGQQTILESFFSNTPTITLPAANDTHYKVNQFLLNSSYKPYVLSWDMFFESQKFSYSTANHDLNNLWENIKKFGDNLEMKKSVAKRINFLVKNKSFYKKNIEAQKEIKKEFSINGLSRVASLIRKIL